MIHPENFPATSRRDSMIADIVDDALHVGVEQSAIIGFEKLSSSKRNGFSSFEFPRREKSEKIFSFTIKPSMTTVKNCFTLKYLLEYNEGSNEVTD